MSIFVVDSFLKTVENGIKKLNNLIFHLKDNKEAAIHEKIIEISNMFLFDQEMAFSKRWVINNFVFWFNIVFYYVLT